MINIATGDYYLKVKELVSWAIQNIPELLIFIISDTDISTQLYSDLEKKAT